MEWKGERKEEAFVCGRGGRGLSISLLNIRNDAHRISAALLLFVVLHKWIDQIQIRKVLPRQFLLALLLLAFLLAHSKAQRHTEKDAGVGDGGSWVHWIPCGPHDSAPAGWVQCGCAGQDGLLRIPQEHCRSPGKASGRRGSKCRSR